MNKDRLLEITTNINKELKTDIRFGDDPKLKIERVPTCILGLDNILGGGLPRKRLLLFTGETSTGKSALAAQCIKAVQKAGGIAAYLDVEDTYDSAWWKAMDVDVENLLVMPPTIAESTFDVLLNLLEQEIDIIVLDSLAALLPAEEAEEDMEHKFIALQARLINKACRKIVLSNKSSIIIFVNQLRAGMNSRIPEVVLPGGKGQEFFSSIILKINKGEPIIDLETRKEMRGRGRRRERSIGYYMDVFVEKSKVGIPFQRCQIPFYFSGKVDTLYGLFQIALDEDIITQAGPYFYFGEEGYLGKNGFIDAMKANQELVANIRFKVNEKNGTA